MGNDLIGEIPPEISQLRFLQYIAFNGNCLYGTIPPEMGSMPNLLSLELQGNGLSGAIPEELNNADKLQLLNGAMQYQYPYQCAASDGRIVNTIFAKGNPENGYNWGLMGDTVGDNVNKWKSMKGLHLVSLERCTIAAVEIVGKISHMKNFYFVDSLTIVSQVLSPRRWEI